MLATLARHGHLVWTAGLLLSALLVPWIAWRRHRARVHRSTARVREMMGEPTNEGLEDGAELTLRGQLVVEGDPCPSFEDDSPAATAGRSFRWSSGATAPGSKAEKRAARLCLRDGDLSFELSGETATLVGAREYWSRQSKGVWQVLRTLHNGDPVLARGTLRRSLAQEEGHYRESVPSRWVLGVLDAMDTSTPKQVALAYDGVPMIRGLSLRRVGVAAAACVFAYVALTFLFGALALNRARAYLAATPLPDGRVCSHRSSCVREQLAALVPVTRAQALTLLRRPLCDDGLLYFLRDPVALALSPDGETLAAASDSRVGLWRLETREELRVIFQARDLHINDIVFSPDGRRLATIAGTYSDPDADPNADPGKGWDLIRIWDVASGKLVAKLFSAATGEDAPTAAFARSGALRVLFQGRDSEWHITSYRISEAKSELIVSHPLKPATSDEFLDAVFTPDGRLLATSGPKIQLWDAVTGKLIRTLRTRHEILFRQHHRWGSKKLAFAPDGKTLAAVIADSERDPTVEIWNVPSGASLKSLTLVGRSNDVFNIGFTHNRNLAFLHVVNDELTLTRWDLQRVEQTHDLVLGEQGNNRWKAIPMVFTPDGTSMALGLSPHPQHGDGIQLRDLEKGRLIRLREGPACR